MTRDRVLVVEDDAEIGDLLCQVLEIAGFEARLSSTGRQAVALSREWQPELLILDLMLPDIDGFSVCRALRATEPTCDIGVLVVTAAIGQQYRSEAFQAGVDRYLNKPFDPELILRELQILRASVRQQRRENRFQTLEATLQSERDVASHAENWHEELLRTTPLSLDDIELEVRLVRTVAQSAIQAAGQSTEHMVQIRAQGLVYRDRLEHRLLCESLAKDAATLLDFRSFIDTARWHPAETLLASLGARCTAVVGETVHWIHRFSGDR